MVHWLGVFGSSVLAPGRPERRNHGATWVEHRDAPVHVASTCTIHDCLGKAMRILAGEGLIYRVPGLGYYVSCDRARS